MTDLSDYYAGGYFLVRRGKPEWEQLRDPLLPDTLVSLSWCMCRHLQVYWGWNPGDKPAALEFGIPQHKMDEFVHWCGTDFKAHMDYVSMFYSTADAHQFVRQFLPDTEGLLLVGAGLHKELEESRWQEPAQGELEGIEKYISQHLLLETGGTVLGYDVVSLSYSDFAHSWLCSGLLHPMHDLFGVRPNMYGLFERYEDARKVDQWIFEDNMQGTRAEPEPYDVWLLLSYPLST